MQNEREITTLLCDLGEVIVEVDHPSHCRKFGELCGIDPEYVWEYMEGEVLFPLERGQLSSEQFHQAVCERFGLELGFAEFAYIFSDIFELMPETVEFLKGVRGKYKLCLLSNTNEMHWRFIDGRWQIGELFDHLVLSHEAGARKPESEIYHTALKVTGATPEECVFFDDIPDYIGAARGLGINAIQFMYLEQALAELEPLL